MAKHNVFISYHHENDEQYKFEFKKRFGNLFIDKSVNPGDYDDNLSDEYIKRLIREDKITDSTVVIVLIGEETYSRKHVDWEISAGLTEKAGGRSGLLGIILPPYGRDRCIPARLGDNVKPQGEYARLYFWTDLIYGKLDVEMMIDDAFERKNNTSLKPDNNRKQMSHNSKECEYVVETHNIRF